MGAQGNSGVLVNAHCLDHHGFTGVRTCRKCSDRTPHVSSAYRSWVRLQYSGKCSPRISGVYTCALHLISDSQEHDHVARQ